MSMNERRQTLKHFEEGKLQFITNPMILTEGFDCPRADCMINAAPTMNNTLYTQKAGRVLRTYPNKKDALLIDFGRNSRKHNLCTAVTLMGGDLPLKTVTKAEELLFEMPEIKPKEVNIGTEENVYDPIEATFKLTSQSSLDHVHQQKKAVNTSITDKDICNPNSWPIEDQYITEKQLGYIQKLAKSTHTFIPRKTTLQEMGLKYASQVIEYLVVKKAKQQATEPLTEKQVAYLRMLSNKREIDMDGQDIYSLTKYEARRIIGRHQQTLRSHA